MTLMESDTRRPLKGTWDDQFGKKITPKRKPPTQRKLRRARKPSFWSAIFAPVR